MLTDGGAEPSRDRKGAVYAGRKKRTATLSNLKPRRPKMIVKVNALRMP
jgi:hypothetical protein